MVIATVAFAGLGIGLRLVALSADNEVPSSRDVSI